MTSRVRRSSWMAAATALAVVITTVLTGAPANAAPGGAVNGQVLVPESPGVFVGLTGATISFFPMWGSGNPTSVESGADGYFEATGLEQGDYRVLFMPPQDSIWAPEWLGNAIFEVDSTILTLGASSSYIDASLAVGGTISGTITSSSVSDRGAAAAFHWNEQTYQWERFSRWANADGNGDYTIRGLQSGNYLLRFAGQGEDLLISTEYWNDEVYWSDGTLVGVVSPLDHLGYDATLASDGIALFRIAGVNRYATGVAVSDVQWDSDTEAVFITGGQSFPDALSAGPAAAHFASPLLLTAAASLSSTVATRLSELSPDYIFIVGGTGSVSATVESQLQAYANVGVTRIAGATRYATSLAVASTFFASSGASTAYLATGRNFPDALTAGPAAANEFGPVVLVNGTESSVSSATLDVLEGLGVGKVVIAGGEPTVSAGIEAQLRSSFVHEVYRRAGSNRYETALLISQGSFPMTDGVFLATGAGFPDALSGAALAGHPAWRSPILLVRPTCVPGGVDDEITRLKPADIFILGGESSVGPGVANGVPCA